MFMSRIMPRRGVIERRDPWSHHAYDAHKTMWAVFGDDPERRRDFVFRQDMGDRGPHFLAVSPRPPAETDTWQVESKAYEPAIAVGDRYQFRLRANPTKRIQGDAQKGRRHDVVMAAKTLARESGSRWDEAEAVQREGSAWLMAQAERHGFALDEGAFVVDGYRQQRFRKKPQAPQVSVSMMDFTGHLRVTDVAAFEAALKSGIGPAKGFGCGLLLIRRP